MEVETPLLVHSPGMEPHLEAFDTVYHHPGTGVHRRLFLPTSPEFHMKRLLSEGFERIYQVTRAFRNNEWSEWHAPEFTMLEWYRAHCGYERIMTDCEMMVSRVAEEATGDAVIRRAGREISLAPPWERITVREAWRRFAGIDLDRCDTAETLREAGWAIAVENLRMDDDWQTLYFKIFLDRIEPFLGRETPAILYEYPAEMAALARISPRDPAVALRFEIYIDGIELGNAFDELTDPVIQRERIEAARREQIRMHREPFPRDDHFLAALERGMPPAAGIALGVDRLVMLILGAASIHEITAFSFLRDRLSDD